MDTQILADEYDCGRYAIANVTALVHGRPLKDVLRVQDIFEQNIFYEYKKMRLHLFQCLERIHFTFS